MQLVNAPQKVTAALAALAAAVGRWCGLAGVSSVFLTEVATKARGDTVTAATPPGWTLTRKQGAGAATGLGECAVLTKDSHYTKILAQRWEKVWDGGGPGRAAHPIYAVIVVAETVFGHVVVLTGCHTLAHVEGIWAHIPMPARFKARILLRRNRSRVRDYLEVVHRWREHTAHVAAEFHADDIVAAPDGNLDAHKPWVRELLHRAWPGMNLAVTKGNDLGRRAVGWVLTTMTPGASRVEKSGPESDHDAGVYDLAHVNAVPVKAPQPAAPPPFEKCTYNGALMDQKTKAFVQAMEKVLGYALTVLQGCYNPGGVAQSAGTHDGGGVIDLAPFDFARKVHVARQLGAFAWHRLAIPGVWAEHIHFGIRNQGKLSPAAQAQQVAYDARPLGFDGLADHAVDKTWHPNPPVEFQYPTAA